MTKSVKKIARKTINICKSVKNAIGKFSYEYDVDYDYEEYDGYGEDDCYNGDEFIDIVREQKENLDNLYADIDNFLEDYEGEHEEEISQAQMSIDFASGELSEIETDFFTRISPSIYNDEIVSAIESIDEAIEYLEDILGNEPSLIGTQNLGTF